MSLDSIVKTAVERYCELLQVFFGTVQEWKSLDDGMERLETLLDTCGVQLLELTVQQLSELFFASEKRQESGLRQAFLVCELARCYHVLLKDMRDRIRRSEPQRLKKRAQNSADLSAEQNQRMCLTFQYVLKSLQLQ